jgi:hypothetical protein
MSNLACESKCDQELQHFATMRCCTSLLFVLAVDVGSVALCDFLVHNFRCASCAGFKAVVCDQVPQTAESRVLTTIILSGTRTVLQGT